MTIGLILLAIVSVLIFFGVAERFFNKIGIASWLAFVLILALVIGAVVPSINFANVFSINIGGFLIPLILTVILCVIQGANSDLTRSILALIAVAGVAIATRMLIRQNSFAALITSSLIVGLVGGGVAYLIGTSRLSTLIASIGGIVLGDVLVCVLSKFLLSSSTVAIGANGVFDSIVISAVTGILLLEAVGLIKRTMNRNKLKSTTLSMESAEDNDFTARDVSAIIVEEDFSDYFDDDVE